MILFQNNLTIHIQFMLVKNILEKSTKGSEHYHMLLFQLCQLQSRLLRKEISLLPPPFLHVESVLITASYLSSDSLLRGREMCVCSANIPLMSRTCVGNGQNIETFNHLCWTYLDQAPSESSEVFSGIQLNTYLSRIQQKWEFPGGLISDTFTVQGQV